jgi:hypothetical protein
MNKAALVDPTMPLRIADRYEVHEILGRGGMACVYRATDASSGRVVALKQLLVGERPLERAAVAALFEREFHTLTQLSHPRVISVFDYGVNTIGPYYTMELLDGGDLRERSPVPWRELCALLFDVCSSLALLHSRRLLHRDISPRNIRCTRDGKAKLIDFGAMVPMGSGGAQVVGTPAFTPPETLHRLALDARTDLFSLGATFYSALTGHMPYPARTFAEVQVAWNVRPLPPSAWVSDIPVALDDLVLSLINLEPELRPQSAFDVMQRLAAIAGMDSEESEEVSRAYLATPTLVGRDTVLAKLRQMIGRSRAGQGGGTIVSAPTGLGRSRVLDACALEAMTQGAIVLRATASGDQEPFVLVRALLHDLLETLPGSVLGESFPELFEAASSVAEETASSAAAGPNRPRLRDLRDPKSDPSLLQQAISRLLLAVCRTQTLVIAVDDVHRIDPASASVLAALIDKAHQRHLLITMTAEELPVSSNATLAVLARRCQRLTLEPLTLGETQLLLSSVFGDVANLDRVTAEIHAIAGGSPQSSMDLAQHLVDRGCIKYASGVWALPASLSSDDLPRSADAALQARIAALSAPARMLGQCHALAFYEVLTHADYRALRPNAAPGENERAVSELLSIGAVTSNGATHTLSNRLWAAALQASLEPESERTCHRLLAEMYREQSGIALVHHLFGAGLDEQGLDALTRRHLEHRPGVDHKQVLEQNIGKLVPCYAPAIRTAERLGRSPRELFELRRWSVAASIASEGDYYWDEAPRWRRQLEHDSGLDLWRADTSETAQERLTRALTAAQERYLATPEADRVYTVEEAIRMLAEYVVFSIAVGARSLDPKLLASLPELLEPFAVFSPVLDAIWNNAIATKENQADCHYQSARLRWMEVLRKLDALDGTEMLHIEAIGNAVAYAVGMMEAQLGLKSADAHAKRLDQDPYHKLSAISLRKIVKLEQGDWNGAERLRREADLIALQLRSPQMFRSLLITELFAYANAGDLAGMQQVIEEMKPLALQYPSWKIYLDEAEARFQLVRGDFAAAKLGFERCVERTEPRADGRSAALACWITSSAGLAEALLSLGEHAAARDLARPALAFCDERQVDVQSHDLVRVLALAEARLGDVAAANARLDALIEAQATLGVTGLPLGLSLEARARIAIWSEDEPAFEKYSGLTAREYRHGARSPLGARYERLVNEALRRGLHTTAELADFQTSSMFESGMTNLQDVHTAVQRAMIGAQSVDERSKRALRLLCDIRAAASGHLYLLSPEGATLTATYGPNPAPEALIELVNDHAKQEQGRSEIMTEIATGTLLEEELAVGSDTLIAGTRYDLVLLVCTVGGIRTVVGVAAFATDQPRARPMKEGPLLTMVATHLLQAGDTVGLALESG